MVILIKRFGDNMDFEDERFKRPIEKVIKSGDGSCFGENDNIEGTLILTNIRIYLQINEEEKINEIILKDVKKVSLGGINVLRFDLKNGSRYNFLVGNIFSWLSNSKKAIKNC